MVNIQIHVFFFFSTTAGYRPFLSRQVWLGMLRILPDMPLPRALLHPLPWNRLQGGQSGRSEIMFGEICQGGRIFRRCHVAFVDYTKTCVDFIRHFAGLLKHVKTIFSLLKSPYTACAGLFGPMHSESWLRYCRDDRRGLCWCTDRPSFAFGMRYGNGSAHRHIIFLFGSPWMKIFSPHIFFLFVCLIKGTVSKPY